ncbi:MAG: hypothetical protein J3K34DRAFT_518016 [Monoraphidium minutum]|nr:MAG: hypothetical protein J3K34DRAFT_518016 [Monoraphidium minutum]
MISRALGAALGGASSFVYTLGAFTPCFIDVVVLGAAHAGAVAAYAWWLAFALGGAGGRWRLSAGAARAARAQAAAAGFCALVPLFELNARAAQQAGSLLGGDVAPHEVAGLLLAACSFGLLCCALAQRAAGAAAPERRWALAAPLLVVASAELVKLRFVVLLLLSPPDGGAAGGGSGRPLGTALDAAVRLGRGAVSEGAEPGGGGLASYFFLLYAAYVAVQCGLAACVAAWRPGPRDAVLIEASRARTASRAPSAAAAGAAFAYAPLPGGAAAAAAARECPEARAGLLSRATFSWMNPLVRQGAKGPITAEDVWELPPGDRVEALEARFRVAWGRQLRERGAEGASLMAACWAVVSGGEFLRALPFKLLNDLSQFLGPSVLNLLLAVVAGQPPPAAPAAAVTVDALPARSLLGAAGGGGGWGGPAAWWGGLAPRSQGYVLAGGLFVGTVVGSLADAQHFHAAQRAGFRLKALFMAETQRKVLAMTPAARGRLGSGRIYTMVSSDTQTLQDFSMNALGVVSSPLRIVIAMALLWRQLGPASLVAVACILATVPANGYLVTAATARLRRALAFTDERARMEGELVTGIDVVKASTWEGPFLSRINAVRALEISQLSVALLMQNFMAFLVNAVPTLVPVAAFATYLAMGYTLTAAEAFTSLSLFQILRFPLFQIPQIVTQATQAKVALGRLQQLLSSEEAAFTSAPRGAPSASPGASPAASPAASPGASPAVSLHGDFTWDPDRPPTLVDIDLDVAPGELVAVVGTTGAGKSSLLMAALGQMPQARGPPPRVAGAVAFVPQAPFVLAGSVRDNILFGRPWDAARYAAAVRAACLETDFAALAAGDATELGERGGNISGGQKQRISIARAVYAGADVVLLDDPLSALDARVAKRVFDLGVRQALAAQAVLLATNQIQFATHPAVSRIVYMRDGRVAEVGTLEELTAIPGGGFAALVRETQLAGDDEGDGALDDLDDLDEGGGGDDDDDEGGGGVDGVKEGDIKADGAGAKGAGEEAKAAAAPPPPGGRLVTAEGAASGRVSAEVVAAYAAACGGGARVGLLALVYLASEAARVGTSLWLSYWTSVVDDPHPAHSSSYYMLWYAAISVVQLLTMLWSIVMSFKQGLHAGTVLHDSVLGSLLGAPLSFFHTTPSGRIINRLTKDTSEVDQNLAGNISFAFRCLLQLVSTLVLIGAGAPFALPALVVLMLAFWRLYDTFQSSMMQIKRLDAMSRSPVLSSVSESLAGVATIRAFGAEGPLMARHAALVDANAAMSLANQGLNRRAGALLWLGVRLESLGALSTFLAAAVSVEQLGSGTASAAAMGLLISYALQITVTTSLTLRMGAFAEQSFNAVERLVEYSNLPKEAAAVIPGSAPEGWPSQGEVEFRDVVMRYRPGLPLVLRGLSFQIPPRFKVGVVGRTGAGKSSVIGALFRLMEAEGGCVLLDGVDTRGVGLQQLRAAMALIPQVPVLFAGTIRVNLSPFGQHSDAELWSAVRRAHLAPLVESLGGGLDHRLGEGGAPLSAGQKQLLALARAVLSPAKVLVLDEATANVDVETDALIQSTMAAEFSDRTIIAVAHRLHTIIASDRRARAPLLAQVLVLDAGRAVEYDSPRALLDIPGGAFASMVRETGAATEAFLRAAAAGDSAAIGELDAAAAAGRAAVSAPCPAGAPESLAALSAELAGRAAGVAAAVRRALRGAGGGGGGGGGSAEARMALLMPRYLGAVDDLLGPSAAQLPPPPAPASGPSISAAPPAAPPPGAADVAAAAAALQAAVVSLDQLEALAEVAGRMLAEAAAASGGGGGYEFDEGDDDGASSLLLGDAGSASELGGGGPPGARRSGSLRAPAAGAARRPRGASLDRGRSGAAPPIAAGGRSRSLTLAPGARAGSGGDAPAAGSGLLARCELESMASRDLGAPGAPRRRANSGGLG